MKAVIGFLMIVAFIFIIAILGKKLFDSIVSFIGALRERRAKKSPDDQKDLGAQDSSHDSGKEVH